MKVEAIKKPIQSQLLWQEVCDHAKLLLSDAEAPKMLAEPNRKSDQPQQDHSEKPNEF